jgi:hypothetical protein
MEAIVKDYLVVNYQIIRKKDLTETSPKNHIHHPEPVFTPSKRSDKSKKA